MTSKAEFRRHKSVVGGMLKVVLAAFVVYVLAVPLLSLVADRVPSVREVGGGSMIHFIRLAILCIGVASLLRVAPRAIPGALGMKGPWRKPVIIGSAAAVPFVICWVAGSVYLGIPIRLHERSLIMALLAVLGPGLFEEGLFRGLLFNRLLTHTTWPKAALVTGAFFGPAHIANLLVGHTPGEIAVSVIAGFVMSFPLGYLFYRSGRNLFGCVAFHVLVAGSMDVLIVEEAIKAHLGPISAVTGIGLVLGLAAVFVAANTFTEPPAPVTLHPDPAA